MLKWKVLLLRIMEPFNHRSYILLSSVTRYLDTVLDLPDFEFI